MGEEESTRKEVEGPAAGTSAAAPPPPSPPAEAVKDVAEEKAAVPPSEEEKEEPKDTKVLFIEDTTEAPTTKKISGGSIDRDAVLAKVEKEKRMSIIKAWEENEKTKAENKSTKKMSSITAWENSKKASVEAELKMKEEALDKKKAEYVEKMRNKIAILHKGAEEKRAAVEAKRGEDFLKAEEMAAKYRATGLSPKRLFGCFGA